MVDLHTHILPGVDDGAKNLDEALQLLVIEKSMGIKGVALTPHFDIEKETVLDFVNRRNLAFSQLLNEIKSRKRVSFPEIKLGAEVLYSPKLLELGDELNELLIEGTSNLLLELPTNFYPPNLNMNLKQLELRGIRVILAHVERYSFFRENPEKLAVLVKEGMIAQVNTTPHLRIKDSFLKAIIKRGYVHIIASDCHDIVKRFPNWDRVPKGIYCNVFSSFDTCSEKLWNDEPIPKKPLKEVKRIMGIYI